MALCLRRREDDDQGCESFDFLRQALGGLRRLNMVIFVCLFQWMIEFAS